MDHDDTDPSHEGHREQDFRTQVEELREFLDDRDSGVQIIQQGIETTIMTKLDREDLVVYLERLTEAVKSHLNSTEQGDIVYAQQIDLPSGDSVWGAILSEPVF